MSHDASESVWVPRRPSHAFSQPFSPTGLGCMGSEDLIRVHRAPIASEKYEFLSTCEVHPQPHSQPVPTSMFAGDGVVRCARVSVRWAAKRCLSRSPTRCVQRLVIALVRKRPATRHHPAGRFAGATRAVDQRGALAIDRLCICAGRCSRSCCGPGVLWHYPLACRSTTVPRAHRATCCPVAVEDDGYCPPTRSRAKRSRRRPRYLRRAASASATRLGSRTKRCGPHRRSHRIPSSNTGLTRASVTDRGA